MKNTPTNFYLLLTLTLTAAGLQGCVTAAVHDRVVVRNTQLEADMAAQKALADSSGSQKTRLERQVAALSESNRKMREDSSETGSIYRRNKQLYSDLFEKYDRLEKSYAQLLSNSSQQAGNLAGDLSRRERELQEQQSQNKQLNSDLQGRDQRLRELEKALSEQKRAADALRNKMSAALLGFQESDLTVDIRNGKVYVSLAEKLLFKSGSYAVSTQGTAALRQVAAVLKNQPDTDILVEGHTDDVPMAKGTPGIDDNWDLSVKRATSIVRILSTAGANPGNITAAGRGRYMPIATGKTTEARQRNRRTEIILTPKLDELFEILGTN